MTSQPSDTTDESLQLRRQRYGDNPIPANAGTNISGFHEVQPGISEQSRSSVSSPNQSNRGVVGKRNSALGLLYSKSILIESKVSNNCA
jgi:hypothetical protein